MPEAATADAPPRPRGARRVLVVVLLTVGYAALLFLRRPAGWSDPTIWAEDGRLFLAGTFNPAADVFTIYAG